MYSTIDTPTTISTIVKIFRPGAEGNQFAETDGRDGGDGLVERVEHGEAEGDGNPTVPNTVTAMTMPSATRSRSAVDLIADGGYCLAASPP